MKGRLLDMGEVAPVRSQSFYRALAASSEVPALIVLRPASPLVLAGTDSAPTADELESCRIAGIPVLPWPGPDLRRLDGRRLVFQLVVPESLAAALGLPPSRSERLARVATWVADACGGEGIEPRVVAGRVSSASGESAAIEVVALDECMVALGDLELPATAVPGAAAPELAEALVAAFEESLGVVFEPSLPTPPEMDTIYEQDEELARAERAGLGRPHPAASASS